MSAVSSFIVASLRYVAPRPFQAELSLAGRGGRAQSMGRCRGVSVGCHGICGGCGKYGVISKNIGKVRVLLCQRIAAAWYLLR